jgi:hypothetical protein
MKFKFDCPIFRIDVFLVIGKRKEAESFCNDLKEYGLDDDCAGGVWEIEDKDTKNKSFLVWVDGMNQYHNMVHETLHLTRKIFGMHGVEFNSDNDEIIAYYQNYWVRKFWNKMSKYVNRKKD